MPANGRWNLIRLLKFRIVGIKQFIVTTNVNTLAIHLSGIIRTASHPDMQKIRISGFFSENKLHWQFEFRLLLFTVCTCVSTFRLDLIIISRSHNTVLYITGNFKAISSVEFSTNLA